jgi:hypothetical protein
VVQRVHRRLREGRAVARLQDVQRAQHEGEGQDAREQAAPQPGSRDLLRRTRSHGRSRHAPEA